jgi:predicted restriction endonuclease
MRKETPCIRHDRAGVDDPRLRDVLADASARAGRDLSLVLRSLYDYDDNLLASWRDHAARLAFSGTLTAAWRDRVEEGRILHLILSNDGYDYQEDVVDNGADD